LYGKLNIFALEKAFQKIIQRHEILRTAFLEKNGEVYQEITQMSQDYFKLLVTDVSQYSQIAILDLLYRESHRIFNLQELPLFKIIIFKKKDDDYFLFMNFHHIIFDGWSCHCLCHELSRLYSGLVEKTEASLPELSLQYADFSVWQNKMISAKVLERESIYWEEKLKDLVALELPTDFKRPTVQSYRGEHIRFTMNNIVKPLNKLAKVANVSLFNVVLSAFAVLLFRYAKQKDIVIGSPVSTRGHLSLENLIGFLVNTLALRIKLNSQQDFIQLLKDNAIVITEAFNYPNLPFEKLVEDLNPSFDPSRASIFQVLFVFNQFHYTNLDLVNLKVKSLSIDTQTTKADIGLSIDVTKTDFLCNLEYSTELFSHATIQRMINHFKTLISNIIQRPETEIGRLNLLTHQEKQQLLFEWNNTEAKLSLNKTVIQLFELQVNRHPNKICAQYLDNTLTYQELNNKANGLAKYMQGLWLLENNCIAICLSRGIDMLVGILAILKLGAIYVPIDPEHPKNRIEKILVDCKPSLILTEKTIKHELSNHITENVAVLTRENWPSQGSTQGDLIYKSKPTDVVYLIYTSGTTGKPKGVLITHKSLVNFLFSMQRKIGIDSTDAFLAVTTISFDIAALELFLPLITGAKVVIADQKEVLSKDKLDHYIRKYRATIMQATPSAWQALINSGWKHDGSIKVLCGGEALPRQEAMHLLSLGHPFWNLYGPTETTIWSSAHCVTHLDDNYPSVPIGFPIANTLFYVLDENCFCNKNPISDCMFQRLNLQLTHKAFLLLCLEISH
jgi:amino acid adenylation domain-containing protein